MAPANQRFIADDAACGQVELRLIMQVEVAALECGMEFRFDPLALVRNLAHVRMEDRPVADAFGARVLERQVRAAHDEDRVHAVLRHGDQPGRDADRLEMGGKLVRTRRLFDEIFNQLFHRRRYEMVRIEQGEFACADAPDDDVVGKTAFQPPGKEGHQLVARRIADGVVDLLEAVDVQVDEIDRLACPDRFGRRLGDAPDHGGARERAGQLVEIGLVVDIFRGFIDAGEERHGAAGGGQGAERRDDADDGGRRHAGEAVAESEFQPPDAEQEAARAGTGDGQQPEERRAARIPARGHA